MVPSQQSSAPAEWRVLLRALVCCMQGAALTRLQQSYTSRDQVCVIPFCGDRAEVLLPPSKSIAMARKRMDSLPCGGGSPLAHGISLVRAMRLQRRLWEKLETLTCKSPMMIHSNSLWWHTLSLLVLLFHAGYAQRGQCAEDCSFGCIIAV